MWIYDYKTQKDNPYRDPPFVKIVHMCYVDNLPHWPYPWHLHEDSYEIAFIMEGSGYLVVDNQQLPVESGSITLVPPSTMHHFSTSEENGMRYYCLRFQLDSANQELYKFFTARNSSVTSGDYLNYIKNTFQVLFHTHQVNGGIVDEVFQSLALGLVQLAKKQFSAKTISMHQEEHDLASEILSYISNYHYEKITLESLAKKYNISPSHLSRIFCNTYHVSPINYLIHSRITFATEYLLKSDLSISEIAEKVGYDNPTHFTNMFIKRIGCTPTEYRERNQNMPIVTD